MIQLSKLKAPIKSPFPTSPYIAQLQLNGPSQLLTWAEVVTLHETARALCPQRFSWWCGLPPELWIVSQIDYVALPATMDELAITKAMRIDIKPGHQFSDDFRVALTKEQLITVRKIAYRVRSDFEIYVRNQKLPTEFEWGEE